MSDYFKSLWGEKKGAALPFNPNEKINYNERDLKEVWFAGGCFWGVQAYFKRIYGVAQTKAGYANGKTQNPSYKEISRTGHAETVYIKYDKNRVTLKTLLEYLFKIIDPTSVNRQGNDTGEQYRTGIYYKNESDAQIIRQFIEEKQKNYSHPIATEVKPILNFYPAEQYHQDYLEKNPGGYCHVDFSSLNMLASPEEIGRYKKPTDEELKSLLSDIQYRVTQLEHTEPPFLNEYWDNRKKGIYVDIVTKQPLFVSNDKFSSDCGWPSFAKPIDKDLIEEKTDYSGMMIRTEVKSKLGKTHLGHVFGDGPKDMGGLRYCINSASLEFIPLENMKEAGYGEYIDLVK